MGAAHLFGQFGGTGSKPLNGMEDQLRMLMETYKTNMMGTMRSTREIYNGFSLAFAAFSIGLGALAFTVPPQKKVSIVLAALLAVLTGISHMYWFTAPTAFLAGATVLFGLSALLDR
jgi:hypothetical protein